MVAVVHHFLPDVAVAHLCAEGPPLVRSKGLLALVRVELEDRVKDRQVQAPHLDPRGPGGAGDGGRLKGVGARVLGGRRSDKRQHGGERLGEAARQKERRGLAVGLCDVG